MQNQLVEHSKKIRTDNYSDIPIELQERKQWVVWKYEIKDGKKTKVPYQVNGFKASVNNPNTWCSFQEVVQAVRDGIYDGIGFMFSKDDDYIGIDVDKCYYNGEFNETAIEVIELLDSYTEFSPSGTGIHIIVRGALPEYIKKTGFKNKEYGVEIYHYGRYFTFTGNRENENEIQERTDEVEEIIEKYFTREQLAQCAEIEINTEPFNMEDDADTWKKMFSDPKTGQDVQAMYRGELIRKDNQGKPDWSATDYYLCQELAYYCDKDFIKMDRMFRNTGLYRDKWDERRGATTYGYRTLVEAAASKKKTVSDYRNDDFQIIIQENEQSILPKNYISKNGCLFKIVEKEVRGEVKKLEVFICRQTPIITRSFMNVEFPQLYHEITWTDKGKTYTEVVLAGDLAIRKELLKLSYKSLAVTDNNAKYLIEYFDRLNMINQSDHGYLVERLGHIKNTFIHPLRENGIKIIPMDSGEKQILEAFQQSGTSEKWMQNVLEPIKKHPKALLMVLASFASVITKDLKLQPFIVDFSGPTSRGKTTILKACASVWGTEHLVNEWNLTKVAAERKAAFLNSFPLLLDDSRKADARQLQAFVYNFSGGRSKGRGSVSGSQREFTWNNILISTGESALTEYAEQAGGVAARIISITGIPFGDADFHFFNNLYNSMENYYGTIGLEFLVKWWENKESILPHFHEYNEVFQKKAHGNEVISRIARYYASIVFTAKLLNTFFNCEIDLMVLYKLFDELMEENKAVDKPKQLLEMILHDLDADRNSIYYEYEPNKNIKAIYKKGTLNLLPAYLKEFLKTEEKAIRNEWLRRGISVAKTNRGKKVDYGQLKHKGRNFTCVAIEPDVVEELGFDFSEE